MYLYSYLPSISGVLFEKSINSIWPNLTPTIHFLAFQRQACSVCCCSTIYRSIVWGMWWNVLIWSSYRKFPSNFGLNILQSQDGNQVVRQDLNESTLDLSLGLLSWWWLIQKTCPEMGSWKEWNRMVLIHCGTISQDYWHIGFLPNGVLCCEIGDNFPYDLFARQLLRERVWVANALTFSSFEDLYCADCIL
jgi:hypothetical protein